MKLGTMTGLNMKISIIWNFDQESYTVQPRNCFSKFLLKI